MRWLLGDELHPGGEASTARALELIDLRPEERLLDVACGTGAAALVAVNAFGCRATGIDYGEESVLASQADAARRGLAGKLDFVRGDAAALPFQDAIFDVVVCECSLCLLPDKRRAVSEMFRVLRPAVDSRSQTCWLSTSGSPTRCAEPWRRSPVWGQRSRGTSSNGS